MSNQQSEDGFTADQGLKFLTFVLRAYQEEYDVEGLTVDKDLLSAVIEQEANLNMNLVIEQDEERAMIKAVVDETE